MFRFKTRSVMLCLLIVGLAVHESWGPLPAYAQAPGKDTKLKELLKERVTVTQELAAQAKQMYKAGRAGQEDLIEASRLAFEAEFDAAESPKERIAALEKYLEATRENEVIAGNRLKAGRGTAGGVLKAKAERLKIEIALERTKAPAPKSTEAPAENVADQVAMAEVQLALKRAQLNRTRVQKAQAALKLLETKALVDEAQAAEAIAETEQKRLVALAKEGVVPAVRVEESRVLWQVAKAKRAAAEAKVAELESHIAVDQVRMEVARVEVEEAELRLKQLKGRLPTRK